MTVTRWYGVVRRSCHYWWLRTGGGGGFSGCSEAKAVSIGRGQSIGGLKNHKCKERFYVFYYFYNKRDF